MAVRDANEIRPAALPMYCSACHGQYPERKHIDFDAAIDRGWYGNDHGTHITMDDLILCEECLRNGAELIGMMDTNSFLDKMQSLEHRLEEETKRAEKWAEYADRMEVAFQHRPETLKVTRPRGRPPKRHEEAVNG